MLDLNKTVLKCPKCSCGIVCVHTEEMVEGARIEARVGCIECGTEFWVCYDTRLVKELRKAAE